MMSLAARAGFAPVPIAAVDAPGQLNRRAAVADAIVDARINVFATAPRAISAYLLIFVSPGRIEQGRSSGVTKVPSEQLSCWFICNEALRARPSYPSRLAGAGKT